MHQLHLSWGRFAREITSFVYINSKMKTSFVLVAIIAIFGMAMAEECKTNFFPCDNGRCIYDAWVCDGQNDCGDWSDEPDPCPKCFFRFECPSGRCISSSWVCDGDNDCGDWSDETGEACPCAADGIRCPLPPGGESPGACIPPAYFCDPEGIWDCPDGSDEANCTRAAAAPRKSHKVRPALLKHTKFVAPTKN